MVQMMLWWENVKAVLSNEKGQGMVEYAVLLVLIALIAAGVAFDGVSTVITNTLTRVGQIIAAL